MIADDRGSQIDRKESCFITIADDREQSQSRLLPSLQSAEVSKLQAVLCWRKNCIKTWWTLRRKFRCKQTFSFYSLSDVIISFKTVENIGFGFAKYSWFIQDLGDEVVLIVTPWRRRALNCSSWRLWSQIWAWWSVCNMWIEPFQILKFSWHCISAPIQKVAF